MLLFKFLSCFIRIQDYRPSLEWLWEWHRKQNFNFWGSYSFILLSLRSWNAVFCVTLRVWDRNFCARTRIMWVLASTFMTYAKHLHQAMKFKLSAVAKQGAGLTQDTPTGEPHPLHSHTYFCSSRAFFFAWKSWIVLWVQCLVASGLAQILLEGSPDWLYTTCTPLYKTSNDSPSPTVVFFLLVLVAS